MNFAVGKMRHDPAVRIGPQSHRPVPVKLIDGHAFDRPFEIDGHIGGGDILNAAKAVHHCAGLGRRATEVGHNVGNLKAPSFPQVSAFEAERRQRHLVADGRRQQQ